MDSADTHVPLLRHFSSYAAAKGRDVDVELLAELLRLRDSYDDLEATFWPAGSVEHLLLERWPSKTMIATPDPEVLVESLDAWFRFLRRTGRMSGRSADSKELTREARRVAPRMGEVSADRSHWSSTKVLMDFGRSRGIELDNLPDEESLQAALDRTSAAWSALPLAERRRLMPDVSGRGHRDDLSECERLVEEHGVDDPVIALLMSFDSRLPGGKLPRPDVTGAQFQRAPYVQQVVELAEWARNGQPLTDRDVLRLAPSRDAFAELGLEAWTRSQLERRDHDESLPGVARVGRERWIEDEIAKPWRSAADCDALDRLWFGGFAAGLLEIQGRKVFGRPPQNRGPEEWLNVGVTAVAGLLERLELQGARLIVVVHALLTSYVGRRSAVSKADLVEFHLDWLFPPRDRHLSVEADWFPFVDEALGWIADTGIIEERDDSIRLTEAGDVFVTWWLDHMREKFRRSR